MDYRREIDGLRALAVVPVILFHAGYETFSGGYVGVDVFFVISGYLITTIILSELEKGKFSITSFYERRARRIFPALFLVMFACIPFAWLWLPSPDMRDFSKSLVAVSVFASNILFWQESGYFDTAAEFKPLLHTWSLAVEEQYYLLFPLFMMLFWRTGKRWMLTLLVVIGIASLALAQWGSFAKPTAAFYLLPTRGWELLVGVFAAFYMSKAKRPELGRGLREFGAGLGLVLISYSVYSYSRATPFPSFYTLVPTIGTVLIIIFATQKTTVGKFIGNKAFVGIGLISYSAYLWHQPLFAFARYRSFTEPSGLVFAALSISALTLAYFSWRFVETPFRSGKTIPSRSVLLFSLLGMTFFISLGFYGYIKDGFKKSAVDSGLSTEIRAKENFIILGDSHGDHLVSGLTAITSGRVTNYTSGGCIPFRNVDRYDYRFTPGQCAMKMNSYLDQIIAEDPEAIIIISTMGPVYLDGTPFNGKDIDRVTGLGVELITDRSIKDRWKVFEIGLRTTLLQLSKLENSKIVFAIDVPELGIDQGCTRSTKEINLNGFILTDSLVNSGVKNCFVPRQSYDERSHAYKDLVRKVVSEFHEVYLFDPTDYFCNEIKCRGYEPAHGFLYRDVDHLSNAGSWFYANRLLDFLQLN